MKKIASTLILVVVLALNVLAADKPKSSPPKPPLPRLKNTITPLGKLLRTPAARLTSSEPLEGRYASDGSYTQSGNSCAAKPLSLGNNQDDASTVVITKDREGSYFLTMEGVGQRQLPKLKYRLTLIKADDTDYYLKGGTAVSGWGPFCGETVTAYLEGVIKIDTGAQRPTMTGEIMFIATPPSCAFAADACSVTYRDYFDLNHLGQD